MPNVNQNHSRLTNFTKNPKLSKFYENTFTSRQDLSCKKNVCKDRQT